MDLPQLTASPMLRMCHLPGFSCRRGGDIIVIGLEKESGTQRGRVIAVLKAGELAPYG